MSSNNTSIETEVEALKKKIDELEGRLETSRKINLVLAERLDFCFKVLKSVEHIAEGAIKKATEGENGREKSQV